MKKKLLSTLLTVSMIAALAVGCGNSSSGEDSGDSQDSSSDGEQTTYEKIMEKGVMTVGTEGTYQPFTYHDENDELTGYDVEVAKAIGEKMGVEVEFSEITWEGLLASLDNGTVDLVLNQVGVTDEREEKYDFTDPYLYSYIALITTGDNTEIDSWESARGKKTSLNVSSNYAAIAEEYEMDITASETFSKDIELLTAGRTDCVINNTIAFNDYLVQKPDVDIKIVDVQEDADTVAIPIPKGNEDLVDAVNKAIKELQDDGTLTKLSEQFLGKDFSHELTPDEIME
ncbi:transporter substrate-binding domain-containing protein [Merdimonas faecis]|uniref:transporter substrate-binding domain-containing protein n=1 Tax=Merdimonas faecis TaxID=1653435 RepID=UPI0023F8F0F9|nr:transporter substrate-binding domain-containing protein [Merdimonas faecis]